MTKPSITKRIEFLDLLSGDSLHVNGVQLTANATAVVVQYGDNEPEIDSLDIDDVLVVVNDYELLLVRLTLRREHAKLWNAFQDALIEHALQRAKAVPIEEWTETETNEL